MKKLALILVAALVAAGCGLASNQSTANEQNIVNQQQDIYNRVQPVPIYDYSMQRQALIDIYNSMNKDTQTWSVVVSYGHILYQCPSIGWPIPAAAQLTNPQQVVGVPGPWSGYINGVVAQAEPNGVYTGNTQGTYVLCLRDGQITPHYFESEVDMFPYEVKVDPATGELVDAHGPASITLNVKSGSDGHAPLPSAAH